MKNQLLCCCLAFALASVSLIAQDKAEGPTQQWKTQVGVGIGYEPFRLFSTGSSSFMTSAGSPVSFYIPIRTSSSLTVEPEFGLYTYSSESTSSGVATNNSASVVRLGAGILATVASTSNTRFYAGPRVGLYLVRQKSTSTYYPTPSTDEMSETDFSIGGSIGAEYFFVESMSFGGEALVTYYSFGEPTYSSSSIGYSSSRSMFSSNVIFFLRWYF